MSVQSNISLVTENKTADSSAGQKCFIWSQSKNIEQPLKVQKKKKNTLLNREQSQECDGGNVKGSKVL